MVIISLVMLKEGKIFYAKVTLNKLPETKQKDHAKRGFIPQAMETLGHVIPAHIRKKKICGNSVTSQMTKIVMQKEALIGKKW